MKPRAIDFKPVPLDIVGGTAFGRYPKVSVEQTFNMIVSDNFLVDYSGYHLAVSINPNGKGRGIYTSLKLNKMVVVIGSGVYLVSSNLSFIQIGSLASSAGDVFIAEDNQGNIMICDKVNLYVYNTTLTPVFQMLVGLGFVPGYIAFHDTRFVSVDLASARWRLSDPLAGNIVFPGTTPFVGAFQTKADIPVAAFAFPGKQSLLFIIGSVVTQLWNDMGLPKFPYQLQTGFNIDYGTTNSDTVANIDNIVCWLGINDRSGPVILATVGDQVTKISNDGIDFKLASLNHPEHAHAFMFKQDGHIFYQITFDLDNFSITYDFNTKLFSTVTDTYGNYHPAKSVAFFNNTYYFVSLNDGNLYELSSKFTTYAGQQIPRIRVCKTVRMPNTSPFVVNNLTFIVEQGVDSTPLNPIYYGPQQLITENDDLIITQGGQIITTENNIIPFQLGNAGGQLPAVDLSISNDGGDTFSNFYRMNLNPLGNRKNRFIYYSLGWCNEFTAQFRFWSNGRIVVSNGTMDYYQ